MHSVYVAELFAGGLGSHLGITASMQRLCLGFFALSGPLQYRLVDSSVDCSLTAAAHGVPFTCATLTDGQDDPLDNSGFCLLLWASPPCQPWSRAGKRLGAADVRDAWPATLAAISRHNPQYLVVENVRGAPVEQWVRDLKRIGYDAQVWRLDAADYGVPSHRERVFLVARSPWLVRAPTKGPRPTHGHIVPWVTMGEALPWLATDAVAAAAALTGAEPAHPVERPDWWHRSSLTTGPSRCIGTRGNAAATVPLHYRPGLGWAATHPELLDRPAPAVMTTEVKGTRASAASGWTFQMGPDRASDAAFLATGRRRLSVAECALLQGFPPEFVQVGWRGNVTEQYRQVGNAVPPPLARAVVEHLLFTA